MVDIHFNHLKKLQTFVIQSAISFPNIKVDPNVDIYFNAEESELEESNWDLMLFSGPFRGNLDLSRIKNYV